MKTYNDFISEAAVKPTAPATKFCCPTFKKAVQEGTDNDGSGPAINSSSSNLNSKSVYYEIGSISTPIKFCPWCGAKK